MLVSSSDSGILRTRAQLGRAPPQPRRLPVPLRVHKVWAHRPPVRVPYSRLALARTRDSRTRRVGAHRPGARVRLGSAGSGCRGRVSRRVSSVRRRYRRAVQGQTPKGCEVEPHTASKEERAEHASPTRAGACPEETKKQPDIKEEMHRTIPHGRVSASRRGRAASVRQVPPRCFRVRAPKREEGAGCWRGRRARRGVDFGLVERPFGGDGHQDRTRGAH
ncbi:hypothetical protein DFH09DRAFT_1466523 [Mycena vulgaris]|nr:hypothetical protein DFH09DRAFT_1466523 [Mycena vulgaris]